MEYIVVDKVFLSELVTEVNKYIAKGWKLQGGISVARARYTGHNEELRYYQALLKE